VGVLSLGGSFRKAVTWAPNCWLYVEPDPMLIGT
jgi:hypothetical protein